MGTINKSAPTKKKSGNLSYAPSILGDKGIHTFPKGVSTKVIAPLRFELSMMLTFDTSTCL